MHLDWPLYWHLNLHSDLLLDLHLYLHANLHLDLLLNWLSNMHLNPHVGLHLDLESYLNSVFTFTIYLPLKAQSTGCFSYLHLQFNSPFTSIECRFVSVFCAQVTEICIFSRPNQVPGHLYILKIACVFGVMGRSLHEIVLPAIHNADG